MFAPARILAAVMAVCGLWTFSAPALRAEEVSKGPQIHSDIVYGHKDGLALTIDIIQPPVQSGAAVLWIQSGGWYSGWSDPHNFLVSGKPYLDRGYTLVIVRHGSAPRYQVPDAVNDVRRAVRYVRLKSEDYGIDSSRLGVIGGSAGGHLTLMLATTGDDGDISSKDEVLRQSSHIAAAVAIFPPTDLRGFVNNPPQAIKEIAALKPPLSFDESLEPSVSPILHVTETSAPMLMIHGDRDELVPLSHSTNMEQAIKDAKAVGKLVVVKGAGHGFDAKQQTETVTPETLSWFDEHLRAK